MHNAPSVNFPVGRSRLAGMLLAASWVAGALAVTAWAWHVEPRAPRIVLAYTVVLLAGVGAAVSWRRMPVGMLTWDGQLWSWSSDERRLEAYPEVMLDLQRALLLRLGEGGSGPWLWLERASLPERWDDLRRAVYSRARTEGLPGAQSPKASPDSR